MAPPNSIAPWKGDEICSSPTPSTASVASVVSIDSLFSDPDMISPTALETPVPHQSEISCGSKTQAGIQLTIDDSFLRHDKYFFKDGNITFLVDGTLFCVHRYFFSRDSAYFSTRFAQLAVRDHEALLTVVSMGDVDRKDFEAFLSVLYPEDFEGHDLSYEQWKSVLHLSTRWEFASLRKLAMKSIKPPTPYDQLLLARAYAVDNWVLPALSALCTRAMPVTLKEARQMSIEDVVLVATVREDIRNDPLPFDPAEIPRLIEAAQADMLSGTADDDSPTANFKSGVAEQEPRSAVAVTAGEGAAEGICEKEAVSSLTKEDDGHGSNDDFPTARFKSNFAEQEPRSAVAVTFGGGATEGICKEEAVSSLNKGNDGHGSDEHSELLQNHWERTLNRQMNGRRFRKPHQKTARGQQVPRKYSRKRRRGKRKYVHLKKTSQLKGTSRSLRPSRANRACKSRLGDKIPQLGLLEFL
ncbi:hypothetical protein BJV78DRAFT_616049 [Lactifluus subvellereus]|nr:hypothetical protein BJV78DRAFT_616049 [Lactifluus subvellereus]